MPCLSERPVYHHSSPVVFGLREAAIVLGILRRSIEWVIEVALLGFEIQKRTLLFCVGGLFLKLGFRISLWCRGEKMESGRRKRAVKVIRWGELEEGGERSVI
jgi:hypothetical protein